MMLVVTTRPPVGCTPGVRVNRSKTADEEISAEAIGFLGRKVRTYLRFFGRVLGGCRRSPRSRYAAGYKSVSEGNLKREL